MFKHLISASQFTSEKQLVNLFDAADQIINPHNQNYDLRRAKNLVMATWFDEPSTRTRLSFESAMLRVGGSVINITDKHSSSFAKGETWEDTIKTISNIADIIVIRTAKEGEAERAAAVSSVPIINAGDGGGEHPTQSILDLYTIYKHFGSCNGLSIGLVGDLKHNRSIHSILKLLNLHQNITYHILHPSALGLNPKEFLQRGDIPVRIHKSMDELVDVGPDVIYMTRIQSERHKISTAQGQLPEYNYNPKLHYLNMKQVERLPGTSLVMHPLPRGQEIAVEVDQDHRASYWRQVKNGVNIRMALINSMLFDVCE